MPDGTIQVPPDSTGKKLDTEEATVASVTVQRQRVVTRHTDWVVQAAANNALATATKAAEAGKRHYITAVSGSYSLAPTVKGQLTVDHGVGTTILILHLGDEPLVASFNNPVECGVNVQAKITLAAGGINNVGNVTIAGYTV